MLPSHLNDEFGLVGHVALLIVKTLLEVPQVLRGISCNPLVASGSYADVKVHSGLNATVRRQVRKEFSEAVWFQELG